MEFIFISVLIWGAWSLIMGLFEGPASSQANKLQIKVNKIPKEEEDLYESFGVFAKGNPGAILSSPLVLIFKLYDKDTSLPLLSTFEQTSERSTRVFEHSIGLGDMADKYWPDWVRVSSLIPETLIGPHKGTRNLELKCYVWYQGLQPEFIDGEFPAGGIPEGNLGVIKHEFSLLLENPGYMEADNARLQIQITSIKLAISIALADGTLDKKEGNVIKKWIKGIIDSTIESQKNSIKEKLNLALENGFNDAKAGFIDIKTLCSEIENIGSTADKFDLIELCLDVMAADGEADREELRQIEEISHLIGIDYQEITKMKDQRLIKLDPATSSIAGMEEKLGINPDWGNEKILSHILSLYGKWNGRLNSLPEGVERDNAQQMLGLIAEARKKYS